jgi:hypothetical protein
MSQKYQKVLKGRPHAPNFLHYQGIDQNEIVRPARQQGHNIVMIRQYHVC